MLPSIDTLFCTCLLRRIHKYIILPINKEKLLITQCKSYILYKLRRPGMIICHEEDHLLNCSRTTSIQTINYFQINHHYIQKCSYFILIFLFEQFLHKKRGTLSLTLEFIFHGVRCSQERYMIIRRTRHNIYILIEMEGKSVKVIGDYKITPHCLGRGSFSEVYLSEDYLGQKIAAKVIPLKGLSSQMITSWQREITILKKCSHQNIVKLIDVKKTKNNLYLFMEYCEDGTLSDLINAKKALPEAEALAIFSQIVKGMKILDTCKVVHRDLKPANILINKGIVKIADFGLAKVSKKNQFFQSMAGSPYQMAPEVFKGDPYTEKVDVYSAGVILFEMLAGRLPFEGQTYADLFREKDLGIKERKLSKISQELREILRKMLHPDPEQRLCMNGVFEFMENYNENQKRLKLNAYKQLSLQGFANYGALGSILAVMKLQFPTEPSSPSTMDLKMYGKLYQRLTSVYN